MTNVGWATLSVIPSFDGFRGKLEKGTSGPLAAAGTAGGTKFGDAAGRSAGTRFGRVFSSVAKGALVGFAAGAAGAIKLAGDSIQAASDLEESTNKVSQIFGDADRAVFNFTKRAADGLGQSNTQAREAASTFGTFGKAAGFAEQKNAKFAKRMTRLASDLASFNNTEPDEAVVALGAALRGENEPIRRFGVLLDEATLKAEALALGILKPVKDEAKIKGYLVAVHEKQDAYNKALEEHGKQSLNTLKAESDLGIARDRLKKATEGTLTPLTQQQKLLAAQSQIFKQTSDAQGDFARTSDGLANQQRRLKARFEDAKAELGKGLLPIMTEAAEWALNEGLPKFEKFSKWFRDEGVDGLKKFGGQVETVVGHAKDLVGQFDKLPSWAKKALGGAAITGAIAGRSGIAGAVGALRGSTPVTPMYVKVVGGAGGLLGGGGKGKGGIPIVGLNPATIAALTGFTVGSVFADKYLDSTPREREINKAKLDTYAKGIPGVQPVANVFTGELGPSSSVRKGIITDYKAIRGILNGTASAAQEARDKAIGLQTTLDKTPREVDRITASYEELEAVLKRLAAVSAGGIPNTPGEATPRGFGDGSGVFAGANINIRANDMRDTDRQLRDRARRAARAGFR